MKHNNSKELKFSILIPTYNMGDVLSETLRSILAQSYTNFEIIINDNASSDNTEEVVKKFQQLDSRIAFSKNSKNLGGPKNMEILRQKATGDIIYLMAADDILGDDALLNTNIAFTLSDDIGAVTRPYIWFDNDITHMVPVRAKKQLSSKNDTIVTINDDINDVIRVIDTLDQLSGLAYRRIYMDMPFHEEPFATHIYPFLSIFKKHPVVFLKDYTIAVRIASSVTRKRGLDTYDKSPILSWKEMIDYVFSESECEDLKKKIVTRFIAVNYIGLVQIKNYAKYRYLFREIYYLLKFRPKNIFSFQFWFFSLGTIIIPPSMLIPMVDWYKNKINSRKLNHIKFNYTLKSENNE
jgi:glycosyltransferase involved in cell wall biosynthesis